jgi:hypothetical protein
MEAGATTLMPEQPVGFGLGLGDGLGLGEGDGLGLGLGEGLGLGLGEGVGLGLGVGEGLGLDEGVGLGLGLGEGLGLGLGEGLGLGAATTNDVEVSLVPDTVRATAVTTWEPVARLEASRGLASSFVPPLKSHGAILSI